MLVPPSTAPPPAYIAPSAASQIITADQEFNTVDFVGDEHEDAAGGSATALVTPEALGLLNGFLDHILFNILAVAKSSQLANIRPAVSDVLKPRLAREVVTAADYELSDYMGGEGDEQFDFHGGLKPTGDFDLIRSWKRTRLRCMVYTRLGDMEEDEEDEYISRDGLTDTENAPRRFSSHIDIVTPAAAIFLTSIIEHLGEQALVISGETSRSRLSSKLSREHDEVTESGAERGRMNRLVVEDYDMEKLAMNATLGRLWRTWRQRVRSPRLSHTLSRESFRPPRGIASTLASSRNGSVATIDEFPARSVTSFDTAEAHEEDAQVEQAREVDPMAIPLPMSRFDVQEILIPGFVGEPVGDIQTMEAVVAHKVRPRSLMVLPSPLSPRPPSSVESSPVTSSGSRRLAKSGSHVRSQSMPTHYAPPAGAAAAATTAAAAAASDEDQTPVAETKEHEQEHQLQEQVDQLAQASSPTASEKRRQLETMYEQEEEPAEFVDAQTGLGDSPQSGLAISTADTTDATSTPVAVPREVDTERSSEKRRSEAVRQSIIAPSLSGASVVVEVSRPGSAQTAYRAEEGGQEEETQPERDEEIIEGQGMAEKPRPGSSYKRPRRQASGDPKKASQSSSFVTNEQAVEEPIPKQGATIQNIPDDAQAKIADARKSVNQTWLLNNNDDDDEEEEEEEEKEQHEEKAKDAAPAATGSSSAAVAAAAAAAGATAAATAATAAAVAKSSSSATSQEPATSSSAAAERASVQRIPSQPPTPSKSSRRSESLSEKRPATSGSAHSQSSISKLKGIITRTPQEEATHMHGASEASAHSSGETSPALEQLIQSEETIHYTLTPKNMRDMEQPSATRYNNNKANRSSTADLASFLKTTAPPGEEPPSRMAAPKASPRTGSVPKHQPIAASAAPKPALSVPRSKMAGLARDAKPTTDSTRDFADFIKSTGPAVPSPTTPTSPAPSTSNRSHRYSDVTDASKKFTRPGSGLSNSTRGTTGSRLQARAAVAPKGEQTSELIDFIREGPPDPQSHRISRSVAPFRSTMDSDDLKGHNVQDLRSSSPDATGPGKNFGSLGSRAGQPKSSRQPAQQKSTTVASAPAPAPKTDDFDAAPMPARKQRRVPDPYAIDDDDDDEALEELLGLQDKPKREEESLIDFLRNASPPPEDPAPRTPYIASPTATNKSSSGGMRARFLRSASEMAPMSKTSKTSLRSANSDIRSPSASQANYTTKPVAASKQPPPVSPPNTLGRQTETSSLADFLKNTEPPEPPRAPAAFAMNRGKDSSGLSRLLMRRKKVEV